MQVNLHVTIGNDRRSGARKTIELDFVPVPGMKYNDGTWHDGRKIIEVTIEHMPGDKPSLFVALDPDESFADDVLAHNYTAGDWQLNGPVTH